jgi:CRP-like cAMP-binding protein
MAEVQSRVRAFPKKALQNTLRERPKLAAEFMALQAERFDWIRSSLELRALRSARERILQYLRMSCSAGPQAVRIDRPLKRIAEDLSLSHETFYRTLAQLVDEGLVRRTKETLGLQKE